jgi:hypothetical protein
MRHKLLHIALACFLQVTLADAAQAAASATVDIPLGTPDGFTATSIASVGNGKFCVSGSVYDDAGPSELALVLLVDSTRRQVLWQTRIPYAHDYVGNTATNCASDGRAYYVLSQESTNSSEELNQTRITINKLSIDGHLQRQKTIEAGFDEWAYLLDVRPDTVSIAGGTSETLNRGGKFATFIAQFNPDLTQTKTVNLDSGAFWTDSSTKLDDRHLFVSGQFLTNTNSSGHDAFAVSKIDLSTRKYLWSSYAVPADTRQAMSVFSPDGTSYTAALTPTNLTVSVASSTGTTVNSVSMKKPICSIAALALDGNVLKAIGSVCKGSSSSAIATIDLGTRTALVHQLDGEVSAPLFDDQSWVGVVSTTAHGKVLRRSAQ